MRRRLVVLILVVAACRDSIAGTHSPVDGASAAAAELSVAATYQVMRLQLPVGAIGGEATGINDSDEIVGTVWTPLAGPRDGRRAVKWTNGVPAYLPGLLPGDDTTAAYAINNAGTAVGFHDRSNQALSRVAAQWTRGAPTLTQLNAGTLNGNDVALAINVEGYVVGRMQDLSQLERPVVFIRPSMAVAQPLPIPAPYARGAAYGLNELKPPLIGGEVAPTFGGTARGAVWRLVPSQGTYQVALPHPDLNTVRDAANDGTLYGTGVVGVQQGAVRLSGGILQLLWSPTYSALAMSNLSAKGRIGGRANAPVTWRSGTLTVLPELPGTAGSVRGVNTCGTMVGVASSVTSTVPVMWRPSACDQ